MDTDESADSILATRDWLEPRNFATWFWVQPQRVRISRRTVRQGQLQFHEGGFLGAEVDGLPPIGLPG